VAKQQTARDSLTINRRGWDAVAPQFCGGTALPMYGPLAPTEDELRLLGDLTGARVLELGCGSGHSLAYCATRGATELWGLDLSPVQIELARTTLRERDLDGHLFCAPMEENPGLPEGHFDLVLSIYALGWTTDLDRTLTLAARALRPGGRLVFSWEHPVYSCLAYEAGRLVMARPYGREGPESLDDWRGVPIVMHRRTLGTFVTAVAGAGLVVERVVEGDCNQALARPQDYDPAKWYSVPRAQLIPTTFVLAARKPVAN
jgi:SAM-dependent methyltransferase